MRKQGERFWVFTQMHECLVQNRQKVKVNPFTFWQNSAISETFFKVNFYENYTSNEAQTKLKTFLRPKETFLRHLKKSQKLSKIVKKLRLILTF